MKFHKYISIIVLVMVSFNSFSQEEKGIPESLEIAIKKGDAEKVSSYFNEYIDLSIAKKEGLYSKVQAKFILKRFFRINPPKALIVKHIGGKTPTTYIISKLETTKGNFKLVLLLKIMESKNKIYQLRIENE